MTTILVILLCWAHKSSHTKHFLGLTCEDRLSEISKLKALQQLLAELLLFVYLSKIAKIVILGSYRAVTVPSDRRHAPVRR